ncbi:Tm-1-like ATP-binding domain-containing protein [Pusillimonas sp. SM2304]|uniref:Tm-1-like ATP-binding domain-containing protein n=1 Tax=Pusillimonas sp. SM2304 TaxID=3073241 RepID=UPI0028740490|nr:Tm-1-like ATP-binding domain-containing protein [Pusillimonas sp. SM2304]MDS1142515.1 Tm-1-like ATP-binding domain-containing protein [Pusillimonas sp. SM2304]
MSAGPNVWVVGTFDTKADELAYLASLIRQAGVPVVTVDISTRGAGSQADIQAAQVASHHESGADGVLGGDDRGAAVIAMGQALRRLVDLRYKAGEIRGLIGIGGSGGTSMIAPALHGLPYGMPKLLVSTLASGTVTPFVGVYDIMVLNPVTDLAGINRLSRMILANAAHAMAGMVQHAAPAAAADARPAIGLTMFGVTTECVQAVTRLLGGSYDCQVFHANGMGGRTLEALARAGLLRAIVDITTTEVGQHLAGGVCDAGPGRLDAAAELGLPWVGSVGALDMINWGPRETIPPRYRGRLFHTHNAHVTLMRSTAEELALAGEHLAARLNQSPGIVRLLLPMKGLSAIDCPGAPFHDPDANKALFSAIERHFIPTARHRLDKLPLHINDPEFAAAVAAALRGVLADSCPAAPD